ncbi:MAG: glutamate racemase [Bdellovibrio sp.]
MSTISDSRPIGVFDSGIGGLTVLKELAVRFPHENFLYLGDTARLPYGSKSPQTIRKYSEQNIHFLEKQNVKAIVIACNTASSQLTEKEFDGLPIYNVIEPGSETALEISTTGKIGILGTRATVNSKAYTKKIFELNPKAQVYDQACPLFVPLAEEGWDADPLTNLIVYRYIKPLLEQGIDTLILGCTHYPILKKSIAKAAGATIELVDSGAAIARWLEKDFQQGRLQSNIIGGSQHIDIMTTDYSSHFTEVALRILDPVKPNEFRVVDLLF